MALIGVQLVVTMVMASFLQKLAPHFSPARWLLCRKLVRYLHPSDEELRQLSGVSVSKPKPKLNRDRRSNGPATTPSSDSESFMVPRNIEIQLELAEVKVNDVMQLNFYPEFQWLVDFSFVTILVYIITEIYYALLPAVNEVNLSMMWCLLVLTFALKVLFSVTAIYFKGAEIAGERSMCITCGFFFMVLAMGILVIDEDLLDFGLEKAHKAFTLNVENFTQTLGIESGGPASRLSMRFLLATWCGFTGAFFTFPGMRLAKMHFDSLRFCTDNPFMRLLFHVSFISPLMVSLLWVKPIARDYFTERTWPGMSSVLMTRDVFETSRLVFILAVVILRIYLMPMYLQSYLNMAHDRLTEMRKEAGRISSLELQRKVARVFYYLCVVALQYIAPLLMCLNLTLALKTLGEYSWSSYFSSECMDPDAGFAQSSRLPVMLPKLNESQSVLEASESWAVTLAGLKQVFSPVIFRGLLGFMTWWVCSVWFATSCLGLVYHSYFVQ